MLVPVPVSNTSPTVAPTTPPAASITKAQDNAATLCFGGHKIKLSAYSQALADNQK